MKGVSVSETNMLAALSTEAIEQLIEEQDDEDGRQALTALLERRQEMDARLAKAPKRKGNRSSAGRAPTQRHTSAVEAFNLNPDKLARLKKAWEEAKDENGEPILSVELIRIGIGAYYDQRKRDDEAKKAGLANPAPDSTGATSAPESVDMGEDTESDLPEAPEAYESTEESEVDTTAWVPPSDDEGDSFPE